MLANKQNCCEEFSLEINLNGTQYYTKLIISGNKLIYYCDFWFDVGMAT